MCTQTDFHLEMEIHFFRLHKYFQIIAKPVFRFPSSKVRRFTEKKESTKPPSYLYTGKKLGKEKCGLTFILYLGYFEAP